MADRYNKIFSLKPNLFKVGSPVVIKAGALLLDNNTNKLLLQIKIENIDNKTIVAVFIDVKCVNVAGENVNGVENFQYLDLNVGRNTCFGEKTPIVLPESTTRSVVISIKKVVFADGTIWTNDNKEVFEPLPLLVAINSIGGERVGQLHREAKNANISTTFANLPLEIEQFAIWVCSCGAFNKNNETSCFNCKVDKNWLFEYTSPKVLQPLLDTYNQEQAQLKEEEIAERAKIQEKLHIEKEEQRKIATVRNAKIKKWSIISASGVALIISSVLLFSNIIIPTIQLNQRYNNAIDLLEENKYEEAIRAFMDLGEHKDSPEMVLESQYRYAVSLVGEGDYVHAISIFRNLDGYKSDSKSMLNAQDVLYNYATNLMDDNKVVEAYREFVFLNSFLDSADRANEIRNDIRESLPKNSISAGWNHTVGLRNNDIAVATLIERTTRSTYDSNKGQSDVREWRNIVAISAGHQYTIGLNSNGTVVATGCDNYGRLNVSGWTNITAISAGSFHTVGLKADGSVVATRVVDDRDGALNVNHGQSNVSDWTDIIAISAGFAHTAGLRADGTVVAVGRGQPDVSDWTNIVAVSAGYSRIVGLRADGTVIITGQSNDRQYDVSGWANIVAISANTDHIVGLRVDGSVVAVGKKGSEKINVNNWTDIVAISAGRDHTVGLKKDGTVVATGSNSSGELNVSGWSNIRTVTN
jgi:TolA-binding protein